MPQPSPSNSISSSPRLDAVPEDLPAGAWKLPASYTQTSLRGSTPPSSKGKEKARDQSSRSTSPSQRNDVPNAQAPKRAGLTRGQWVVDLDATAQGRAVWASRGRVILVVGAPTAEALSPLLFSPSFSDTLLLIGTVDPIPSIEALLSTPDSPNHIIYPIIRTFSLPPGSGNNRHPISAIFEEAHTIAKAYHSPSNGKWLSSSKRSSSFGTLSRPGSETPSSSFSRPSSMFRAASGSPGTGNGGSRSATDMAKYLDQNPTPRRKSWVESSTSPSLPRMPSQSSMNGHSAPASPKASRMSLLSFTKTDGSPSPSPPSSPSTGANNTGPGTPYGSPFDAVINFIPPPATYAPSRAMQDMLQESIIVTTGAWPLLMLRSSRNELDNDIPILQIVPSQVPGPLAQLVENFVLSFGWSFKGRLRREINPVVVSLPVWLEGGCVGPTTAEPGAELLLFGGVRSHQAMDGARPRAYLSKWSACSLISNLVTPGLGIETDPSQLPLPTSPLSSHHSPSLDSPPLSPPMIFVSTEHHGPMTQPPSALGYTDSQLEPGGRRQPPTPDLEHTSSCSSASDSAPQSTGTQNERDVDVVGIRPADVSEAQLDGSVGGRMGQLAQIGGLQKETVVKEKRRGVSATLKRLIRVKK